MKGGIILTKSKTLQVCCFCFFVGIILADLSLWVLWGGLLLVIVLSSCFGRVTVLFLLCMLLGYVRMTFALPDIPIPARGYVQGIVVKEPDVRQDGVRYIVKLENEARVIVVYTRYPRFEHSDVVGMQCTFRRPEAFDNFHYEKYLALQRVTFICDTQKIEKIEGGQSSMRSFLAAKLWVAGNIERTWPEPYAGFMAGLLYGYRGGLGSLNEAFARTGVTHIIAISGYNITIITTILSAMFVRMGVRRQKSFRIVVGGIIVFVIFVGASASVVRAAIFGILVILAKHIGRCISLFHMMVITCALMVMHNPYILLWDVGFQLSFLATIGLGYIAPRMEHFFCKVPNMFEFRTSLVATLAATIMTFPLLLYQFGKVSFIGIVVNVLILWTIPIIMGLGFFALLCITLPIISTAFAYLAWLFMVYVVTVVRTFARFDSAIVHVEWPWWMTILTYSIFVWLIRKKT